MPILSGQKTIATAGTALALGNQEINIPLMIKALDTNTGIVAVGNDGFDDVTLSNGIRLEADDVIIMDFVDNLSNIFLDASVNGDGVSWLTCGCIITKNRILPAILPAYSIPIKVTTHWNSPSNCAIDIDTATGMPIVGVPVSIIYDLYFYLWDGYDDTDNYACLMYDVGVPEYVYKDIMGSSTPWSSVPDIGNTTYLLMTRVKK